MKSILEYSDSLSAAVWQVAEAAGYLWMKGWAERNGGNITVNVTEHITDEIRALPAITQELPIGVTLPHLKGCWFYCKGTQKRMRDLARNPMANGSIIRIKDDCAHYEIVADNPVMPTSELPSHLSVHNYLIAKGSPYKASLHTHPIELVALTHSKYYMGKDVAGRLYTSKVNGNSVFFPAAGRYNGSVVYGVGSSGYYWSSSWRSSLNAWRLEFTSEFQNVYYYRRYYGESVRGVFK